MKSLFLFKYLHTFLLVTVFSSLFNSVAFGNAIVNRFGYIPTPPDKLASLLINPQYRGFLPVSVDLSNRFPTVGDQRNLNSCVGWSVGYAARSYYAVVAEGRERNQPDSIPSPSFIYHATRNPADCQSGAHLPDALELLKTGSVSLSEMPYTEVCHNRDALPFDLASDFKISKWLRIDPSKIDDVKSQVAQRHPVIFGMMVTDDFVEHRGSGVYSQQGRVFNGHSMTILGYDDRLQAFRLINSWGSQWGENGFGWISYDTFSQHVHEAYAIRVIPSNKPEPTIQPKVVIVEPKPRLDENPAKVDQKPIDLPEIVTPSPKETEVVVKPADEVLQKPEDLNDNCSNLEQDQVNGRVRISGFVGTQAALQRLKETYPSESHDIDVDLRPWPQCEVLLTLGDRLLADDSPKLSVSKGAEVLKKGEPLTIEVVSPKTPAFMYISYVQADGSVVTLHQPSLPVPAPSKSNTKLQFGDGREGRAQFEITSPFGREMIIVVASASPLFVEPLPNKQIEREYLSQLRQALLYKADSRLPDREVTAAYFGLVTKEK